MTDINIKENLANKVVSTQKLESDIISAEICSKKRAYGFGYIEYGIKVNCQTTQFIIYHRYKHFKFLKDQLNANPDFNNVLISLPDGTLKASILNLLNMDDERERGLNQFLFELINQKELMSLQIVKNFF